MGHAGAIISGGKGTAAEKIRVMEACGIRVAPTPADIGDTLVEALKEHGILEKCITVKLILTLYILSMVCLKVSNLPC